MLKELISQGAKFETQKEYTEFYGYYISGSLFEEWKSKSLMYLQNNFPNHPQTEIFKNISSQDELSAYHKMLSILKAFGSVDKSKENINADMVLENIFKKFQRVSTQLKQRYDSRDTIIISDEYDVQDLLNALMRLYFDDIRVEDWVPEYAGGKTRVDFLLKSEKIIIEVKKTRDNLRDKEIGNQLISDIAHYKAHPDCNKIICFVYDPDGLIRNPLGLERDLDNLSEINGVEVKTFIFPRY